MGVKMNFIRHNYALKVFYKNLKDIADNYKQQNRRIIVFGTSKIAGMITAYLHDNGMEVSCIIDNAKGKQGKKAFGLDIYSPEILQDFDENVLILIASMFQDDMVKQLENMGYTAGIHIVKVIDLPALMNDYSFVDRTQMQRLTQEEVKSEMIRVLEHLKDVCDAHHLKYYLFAGTLLGAVRHKGFIPWDDDIDVLVEIKDMKKLSEILKNDPEFSMVAAFDDSDYYDDEMAVMFSNRYVVDSNHFPMQYSAGITIDVFSLFGVPDKEEEINEFLDGYKELDMKRWSVLYDREKCQEMSNKIYDYLCQYDFYKSKYVASTANQYTKSVAPQEYYLNSALYDFEGMKLCGPSNYDYILRKIYGDYMVLPPVEKRAGWHTIHAYKKKVLN